MRKISLLGAIIVVAAFAGQAQARRHHVHADSAEVVDHREHLAPARRAASVVLVNPDGHPIGGQWQQWVDGMRIPTVSGTLTFVPNVAQCGGYPGCSTAPRYGSPTFETWVAPGPIARYTLYFELGHQFDWRYLTTADRRYLMRMWLPPQHAPVQGWFTGPFAADPGWAPIFAIIYSDCAQGVNDNNAVVTSFGQGTPEAQPRINTCLFIDQVARRHLDWR